MEPDSDTLWRMKYGRSPLSRLQVELLPFWAKITAPYPERLEIEKYEMEIEEIERILNITREEEL